MNRNFQSLGHSLLTQHFLPICLLLKNFCILDLVSLCQHPKHSLVQGGRRLGFLSLLLPIRVDTAVPNIVRENTPLVFDSQDIRASHCLEHGPVNWNSHLHSIPRVPTDFYSSQIEMGFMHTIPLEIKTPPDAMQT